MLKEGGEEGIGISEKNLSREILRYLQEHPNAKDTAAGISKWWLSSKYKSVAQGEIEKVLEKLVMMGFLGKKEMGKGAPLFFLRSRVMTAEMKNYLE